MYKYGFSFTKHPKSLTLFRCWRNMHNRCYNTSSKDYHRYGGRGIKVCERWHDFPTFKSDILEDIGWKPAKGYSLDRINNDRWYGPGNVKWSTLRQQANNKGNNVRLTFQGKTRTLPQWARIVGLPREIVRQRLHQCGWSVEKALTTPKVVNIAENLHFEYTMVTYKGETLTLYQWADRYGMNPRTLATRLKRNWSVKRALKTPVQERSK